MSSEIEALTFENDNTVRTEEKDLKKHRFSIFKSSQDDQVVLSEDLPSYGKPAPDFTNLDQLAKEIESQIFIEDESSLPEELRKQEDRRDIVYLILTNYMLRAHHRPENLPLTIDHLILCKSIGGLQKVLHILQK